MNNETLKIYVWPDGSWESEEEIDDMDWFLSSSGKSDDYKEYEVPFGIDQEDINELIELKALPGMIPPKKKGDIVNGKIFDLEPDSILVINVPPGDAATYITRLEGKVIIKADPMSFKILNSGDKDV